MEVRPRLPQRNRVERQLRRILLSLAPSALGRNIIRLVIDDHLPLLIAKPEIDRSPNQRAFHLDDEIPLALHLPGPGCPLAQFTAGENLRQFHGTGGEWPRQTGQNPVHHRPQFRSRRIRRFILSFRQVFRIKTPRPATAPAQIALQIIPAGTNPKRDQ